MGRERALWVSPCPVSGRTLHRLGSGWQAQLHRQMAGTAAQAYGARAREVAAELAVHFECGRGLSAGGAVSPAGGGERRRSMRTRGHRARHEGLELLATAPGTPARAQQETRLAASVGPALQATKGSTTGGGRNRHRGAGVVGQVGDTPRLFPVLRGLANVLLNRGACQRRGNWGNSSNRLAQRTADPTHLLDAHTTLAIILFSWATTLPPDALRAGDCPPRPHGAAGPGAPLWWSVSG